MWVPSAWPPLTGWLRATWLGPVSSSWLISSVVLLLPWFPLFPVQTRVYLPLISIIQLWSKSHWTGPHPKLSTSLQGVNRSEDELLLVFYIRDDQTDTNRLRQVTMWSVIEAGTKEGECVWLSVWILDEINAPRANKPFIIIENR